MVGTPLMLTASQGWRTYLQMHLSTLETVLSAAATASILARAPRPLRRLAYELDLRTPGHEASSKEGQDMDAETAEAWSEEASRRELEQAIEIAVDAALEALPLEPIGWVASYVHNLSVSAPAATQPSPLQQEADQEESC